MFRIRSSRQVCDWGALPFFSASDSIPQRCLFWELKWSIDSFGWFKRKIQKMPWPNTSQCPRNTVLPDRNIQLTRCDMFVRTFSGLHAQYLWPILTPSLLRPFSDMLPRSVASAFRDMLSLEPSLREIMHSAVGFQRRLVAARLEPFFGSIRTRLIYCKVLGGLHLAPKRTQTNPTNSFFFTGPSIAGKIIYKSQCPSSLVGCVSPQLQCGRGWLVAAFRQARAIHLIFRMFWLDGLSTSHTEFRLGCKKGTAPYKNFQCVGTLRRHRFVKISSFYFSFFGFRVVSRFMISVLFCQIFCHIPLFWTQCTLVMHGFTIHLFRLMSFNGMEKSLACLIIKRGVFLSPKDVFAAPKAESSHAAKRLADLQIAHGGHSVSQKFGYWFQDFQDFKNVAFEALIFL